MIDPQLLLLQIDTQLAELSTQHEQLMEEIELKHFLTQREQLMEDIDSIVESYLCGSNVRSFEVEELVRILCDAVCKNFPV